MASFSFFFQSSNQTKQAIEGPSKHLEAKELRGNLQKSITSKEDSTHSGDPDLQPDTLFAMVHNVIKNDSTMFPCDVVTVHYINRGASTSTNRAVYAHRQCVLRHVNTSHGQLMDRGANGGLAGSDMKVIHKTNHKASWH